MSRPQGQQNRPHTVFIDFSKAYDRVNRSKLYKILEEKEILKEDEIELLKCIH